MTKKVRKIENVPTTDILWAVSRTGYNFNEALGDIIDNSVDAHRQKYKEQKHKDGFIRATCLSWQQNKKKKRTIPGISQDILLLQIMPLE